MTKFITSLIAAAATLVPVAATAQDGQQRFTRDGETYVYTVATATNGRQVIEGRRLRTGSAFRLVVVGDRIEGMSGGQPVSFRAPRSRGVTLASR